VSSPGFQSNNKLKGKDVSHLQKSVWDKLAYLDEESDDDFGDLGAICMAALMRRLWRRSWLLTCENNDAVARRGSVGRTTCEQTPFLVFFYV